MEVIISSFESFSIRLSRLAAATAVVCWEERLLEEHRLLDPFPCRNMYLIRYIFTSEDKVLENPCCSSCCNNSPQFVPLKPVAFGPKFLSHCCSQLRTVGSCCLHCPGGQVPSCGRWSQQRGWRLNPAVPTNKINSLCCTLILSRVY